MLNAAASVVDVALAMQYPLLCRLPPSESTHRIVNSLLNFALSHGVIMLCSVLHHVPTAAPHSWLLRYLRGVMLVYTLNACLHVWLQLHELIAAELAGGTPDPFA